MATTLRRRDFIGLSGLGMTLVPGRAFGNHPSALPGPSNEARVARTRSEVGYWLGSEGACDIPQRESVGPELPFTPDVVSAHHVEPDPELECGAAVTIHGLVQGEAGWQSPELEGLAVTVRYPSVDPSVCEPVDFQAWGFVSSPVVSRGSPIRFTVPRSPREDVTLRLERRCGAVGMTRRLLDRTLLGRSTASPAGPVSSEACFSSLPGWRTPKLRRGIYLIAVGDRPEWSRIAWDEYRFRLSDDAAACGRLERVGPGGPEPVTFDYLVVAFGAPAALA